jgi:hypothetical protein
MLDYCARASWPTEADVPLFSDAAVGVAEERLYLSSGFGGNWDSGFQVATDSPNDRVSNGRSFRGARRYDNRHIHVHIMQSNFAHGVCSNSFHSSAGFTLLRVIVAGHGGRPQREPR